MPARHWIGLAWMRILERRSLEVRKSDQSGTGRPGRGGRTLRALDHVPFTVALGHVEHRSARSGRLQASRGAPSRYRCLANSAHIHDLGKGRGRRGSRRIVVGAHRGPRELGSGHAIAYRTTVAGPVADASFFARGAHRECSGYEPRLARSGSFLGIGHGRRVDALRPGPPGREPAATSGRSRIGQARSERLGRAAAAHPLLDAHTAAKTLMACCLSGSL